jgi:catechol 2,3-dioxygenase-like lactoylglutathione lyase family enzyme
LIHHIYLPVKDIDRSLQFYAALLTPLDFAGRWDFKVQDSWPDLYGFGGDRPRFWLKRSTTTFPELYVAFIATSKEAVEKAYAAPARSASRLVTACTISLEISVPVMS